MWKQEPTLSQESKDMKNKNEWGMLYLSANNMLLLHFVTFTSIGRTEYKTHGRTPHPWKNKQWIYHLRQDVAHINSGRKAGRICQLEKEDMLITGVELWSTFISIPVAFGLYTKIFTF